MNKNATSRSISDLRAVYRYGPKYKPFFTGRTLAGSFIHDVPDSTPATSDGRSAYAKVLRSHFYLNTSYTTNYKTVYTTNKVTTLG